MYFSAKYLSAPLLIVSGTWAYCRDVTVLGRRITWSAVGIAVCLVFPMLLLCSQGYVSFINASIGNQQQIAVDGTVVDKVQAGTRRSTSYVLVLVDAKNDEPIEIKVDNDTFRNTPIHGKYRLGMTKGSLGILYR